MSSVNDCFFFSFPRLLFCLLVVSIISRVMSHIIVDIFPSHPPSLFLSPTHTDEQTSFSYSLSLTNTHAHTSIRNHLLRRSFVPKQSIFFIILPLVCFVLSVTFVCFVFWTYENSISILCKQTTTPSVITIGSLPIHLPSPTILLSLTRIHTHSYTYILALIYTAIKRFS